MTVPKINVVFFVAMSTTMDQVVKKAKDSFGQIFDKSLHDLVRGIRYHKENEVILSIEFLGFFFHFVFLLNRLNISMPLWMKSNKNSNRIIWQSKPMLLIN